MMIVMLGIVVFVMAALLDFADCRCTLAVTERRANAAATWSVLQYAIGAVGFVLVVEVSLWLMLPEGLGLYAGTRLALARPRLHGTASRMARVHRLDLLGSLAAPVRRADGTMIAEARLTRTGVFPYRQADGTVRREYRPPAEVFKAASLASLRGVPMTNDHPPVMIDATNAKKYAVGSVLEARRDGDYIVGSIVVHDADAIRAMEAGKKQVSSGYDCDLIEEPGVTPEGERFDAMQTNIEYNHQAIVHNARAGATAAVRMDAAFTDDSTNPLQPSEDTMNPEEQVRALKLRLDEADKTLGERKDALDAATRERDVALAEVKTMKERVATLETQLAAGSTAMETEAITKVTQRADAADAKAQALEAGREEAVRKSADIRIKAMAVMGPKFRTDGVPDRQICATVIKKFAPQEDCGEKVSDAYLVSRFDSLCDAYCANARSITRVTEVTGGSTFAARHDGTKPRTDTKEARAKAWREQAFNPNGYQPDFSKGA